MKTIHNMLDCLERAANDRDQLATLLSRMQPGPLQGSDHLERLLAGCWDEFQGSDEEGMAGHKIRGRLERVEWKPPLPYS